MMVSLIGTEYAIEKLLFVRFKTMIGLNWSVSIIAKAESLLKVIVFVTVELDVIVGVCTPTKEEFPKL